MTAEIDIERKELLAEIEYWNGQIAINSNVIELAFFKVFVKFEKFIIDSITRYSIGLKSSYDYAPKRRLEFESTDHFMDTVNNRDFFEINERLEKIVKQVFEDDNPISFFFSSADRQFYDKLKCLRNYIAHESDFSRMKYIRQTLNNGDFITPIDYLLKPYSKKNSNSNYTMFIKMVEKYSESILRN